MLALLLLAAISWKPVQPGVDYATIDSLHVVRVDPLVAQLEAGIASEGHPMQTAAQWCGSAHLSVAINLGMFNADQRTHTGYLRDGKHVNNAAVNDYRSVLAFRSLQPVRWIDLDGAKLPDVSAYDVVVQNLRLIAGNRRNVWAPSDRKWSEAALAIDGQGRLLFLFSRVPYTMRDFNALLLRLPLDVRQAMHLEGGPEASLSVHGGGIDVDLCGSYETGFMANDSNRQQWPLPNVLGITR
jgi:uncharacterized protein YigE (DUF2233 family)